MQRRHRGTAAHTACLTLLLTSGHHRPASLYSQPERLTASRANSMSLRACRQPLTVSSAGPAGHLGRQAGRRLEHDQVRRRRDPSGSRAGQPDGPLRHLPGARQPQLRLQCALALPAALSSHHQCLYINIYLSAAAHLCDARLTQGTRSRAFDTPKVSHSFNKVSRS